MANKNYYEILEVNEKASIEVIDKAYRVLAKKYHPDVYEGDKKEAESMMQKLNEAYDVLSDENKRSNYDAILQRKKQIELEKSMYEKNKNSSKDTNINTNTYSSTNNFQNENDSPINNPAKYNKDKFVVDTTYMDEKQKKKIKKKLQERYVEAYDNYLRSRGYKLKYKWTPKRVLKAILIVAISIIILTIIFYLPPIHNHFTSLYETNPIFKMTIDLVSSFFSAIVTTFSSIFDSIF